jgi:hypothetical protein
MSQAETNRTDCRREVTMSGHCHLAAQSSSKSLLMYWDWNNKKFNTSDVYGNK